jgi:phosphoribosylformimino-5-aminoimidazole carboxamide ribotide isomerase
MQIIPVIDILGGVVVRAVAGRRDDYKPLLSPLCASCAPLEVVATFMRLHSFPTIYIADLDAIMRRGDNSGAVLELSAAFPHVEFWLDAGAGKNFGANISTVVGSESLSPGAPPPDLAGATRRVLSLDFRGAQFLGPSALRTTPALWPARVIVMSLARIGVGEGPDMATLEAIKASAGNREIFAAGGLRGVDDLRLLSQKGIAGALVASALHDGRLDAAALAQFVNTAGR